MTPIPEPSASPFQSRIPAAPRTITSDAAGEATSSDAWLASGAAQPLNDAQQNQPNGAALQQQQQQPPAAEEVQVQQHADAQQQLHLNGLDQRRREADAAHVEKEQLPTVCCVRLTKSVEHYGTKHVFLLSVTADKLAQV